MSLEDMMENKSELDRRLEMLARDDVERTGNLVSFSQMGATDDDVKRIAQAVKENEWVTQLNLSWNQITDEGVQTLVEALKDHPNLREIELSCNDIDDEGAKLLADFCIAHPKMESICIRANAFGDEGAEALLGVLDAKPDLIRLSMRDNKGMSDAMREKLANMTNQEDHPNMLEGGATQHIANVNVSHDAYGFMLGGMDYDFHRNPGDFVSAYEVLERRAAVEYLIHCGSEPNTAAKQFEKFNAVIDSLPVLDPNQPITYAALIKEQPVGDDIARVAPIDNPKVWLHLEEVVAGLNAQGEYWQGDFLLNPDGEPSELLERIVGTGKTAAIFTIENWKDGDPRDFKAVLDAMGEDVDLVSNRHGIGAMLSRQQNATRER